MQKALPVSLFLCLALSVVNADIYLHTPRGSNNRLNENSRTRRNNNRLFDSQNNNNGGYNVGDLKSTPAGTNEDNQYKMKYFQSGHPQVESPTLLDVEWTNQHGCGGPPNDNPKVVCNLVLQYMCQPNDGSVPAIDRIRAGVITNQQPFRYYLNKQYESLVAMENVKKANVKSNIGLHESWEYYDRCTVRENNKGLFTADQKLKKKFGFSPSDQRARFRLYSRAATTRQNNNGKKSGYECPEERDYYPYWHPTPWIDIAVLAEQNTMCSKYQQDSFNTKPYGECVEQTKSKESIRRSRWNNKDECEKNKGTWVEFYNFLERAPEYTDENSCNAARTRTNIPYIWGLPSDAKNVSKKECLVAPPPVICETAPFTRVNHLGNTLSAKPATFTWVLPHFPSGKEQRCVLRMRYNISTTDYDPATTNSSHNGQFVTNDPTIKLGEVPLKLAINTAQFGRTFQDRSHPFLLMPRPKGMTGRILNLNVRGKRGNIVQVYPAVEYDFVPNKISMKSTDMLHIQWTGSNTNPRNFDGEGTAGTDRSNLLQMKELSRSYPLPYENTTLWKNSKIVWIHHGQTGVTAEDLAVDLASSGYYSCVKSTNCPSSLAQNSVDKKAALNNVLNNAPASYKGVVLKIEQGVYYYMCTRNNNFTNRSQKGSLTVA